MRFDHFSFGTIRIDGSTCEHDVVIDRGEVRKRKKGPSKQFSDAFGHTPLSMEEKIPWKCRQLIIGTGAYGRLPVMKEVESEAKRRKVELVVLPTSQAIDVLNKNPDANQRDPSRDVLSAAAGTHHSRWAATVRIPCSEMVLCGSQLATR